MALTTNLGINGMQNEDCANKVKAALEKLNDVEKVVVNLETKYADVTLTNPSIKYHVFKDIIKDVGYELDHANNYMYVE